VAENRLCSQKRTFVQASRGADTASRLSTVATMPSEATPPQLGAIGCATNQAAPRPSALSASTR
jgi:hypothetical protein